MRPAPTVSSVCILACIGASPASAATIANGEFYAYDQNAWGAHQADRPPASLVPSDSFTVFTTGLEIGDEAPGGYGSAFATDRLLLPGIAPPVPKSRNMAPMLSGWGPIGVAPRYCTTRSWSGALASGRLRLHRFRTAALSRCESLERLNRERT